MQLYWSARSIPEVRGLPKKQARYVVQQALNRSPHRPYFWFFLLGGSLGGALLGVSAQAILPEALWGKEWLRMSVIMANSLTLIYLIWPFWIHFERPYIRQERERQEAGNAGETG